MYSRISIKNLRGIESLEATGLRPVNLVVGRNNSGKSTFLEGLFLLGGATNPQFATKLGQLRNQQLGETNLEPVWKPLFHNMDPRIPIEIRGQWAGEPRERELLIESLEVSSYTASLESPFGGEPGIAAVSAEFVFGGLSLHSRDNSGNELVTNVVFEPSSGKVAV